MKLNLGLSYSFGRKRNFRQYVNLGDPDIGLGLLGPRTNTAKVIYDQYRIYFGIAFDINANKSKKPKN